jgi:hypothetical protein
MLDLRAPDFSSQPINTLTIQYLTVPAYATAYLTARSEAAWEQAVVVYVNGQRHSTLLGNYHHPGIHWLSSQAVAQQVMLAGWHKRSGPDGGQQWHASRGQTNAKVARWDDSGGDGDFNDIVVELTVLPGPSVPPGGGGIGSSSSPLVAADDAAEAIKRITAVAAVATTYVNGEARTELLRYAEDAVRRVTERYVRAHSEVPVWPSPLSASIVLAAELELIAQSLLPGSIRARLEELQRQMLSADAAVLIATQDGAMS